MSVLILYVLTGAAAYYCMYFAVSVIFFLKIINGYGYKMFIMFMKTPFLFFCGNVLILSFYYVSFFKNAEKHKKLNKVVLLFVPFIIIFWLCAHKNPYIPLVNKYNLLSFHPNETQTSDYANEKNKDDYPACTFQYNSLGYRDMEPDSSSNKKHRILIIGDSYIWGDGIPENHETIASFLRNDLDKKAFGQYTILSTAFPGLGLYGYSAFLKRLKPHFNPEIVFIGFLGESDFDPYDFQFLVDQLPANYFLRNLILNLHIIQHIHEMNMLNSKTFWFSKESYHNFQALLQNLSDYASRDHFKVVLINYSMDQSRIKIPNEIGLFDLPDRLKYKGKRSKFWYAKDNHPKPLLNELLANMLSHKIIRYFQNSDENIFAQNWKE